MNSVTKKHRRVKHQRISRIMPLTQEQRAAMQWILDYCDMLELCGNEQVSSDYADSLTTPQCGRAWSGSAELYNHWHAEYKRQKDTPKHDMELAQEDVDRHGLRYVQGAVFGGGAIGQDESERPYLY